MLKLTTLWYLFQKCKILNSIIWGHRQLGRKMTEITELFCWYLKKGLFHIIFFPLEVDMKKNYQIWVRLFVVFDYILTRACRWRKPLVRWYDLAKGQLISKGFFAILNSSKKRTKQFNFRYHSSKVEFLGSLFGRIGDTKIDNFLATVMLWHLRWIFLFVFLGELKTP